MKPIYMNIPVTISTNGLIEAIYGSIDHEEIPQFIADLDVYYADFGVTKKAIGLLLDSTTEEFEVFLSGSNVEKWKLNVAEIKKMMEDFE